MDILGKLFGSQGRVKILRLFFLNPLGVFDADMVSEKSKVRLVDTKKELKILKSAGIIGDKVFTKEIFANRGGKKDRSTKRVPGYQLSAPASIPPHFKDLIISQTPLYRDEIARRFRGVGKIKFLAVSGIFINEPNARVDLFIVGDNIKNRLVENELRSIESEIGKELSYGTLDTEEFLYRVSIYDKFVRDVLDFHHDTVIDKLGVEEGK